MNYQNWLFFVLGVSVMFFALMSFFFSRGGKDPVSVLMKWLMALICIQCSKDVAYLLFDVGQTIHPSVWADMTGFDMTAEPFYAFILMALCRPGRIKWSKLLIHEIPFVVLPLLMATTGLTIFYDLLIAWGVLYGSFYGVLTLLLIPRYHKRLRDRFSYMENINLNWLRVIVLSFFVILGLWTFVSLTGTGRNQAIYISGLVAMWMCVCYFLLRHESVMDELTDELAPATATQAAADAERDAEMNPAQSIVPRIERAFREDMIYLNPRLKLSDVARAVGSNRTYVSNVFNREMQTTFYEYVNAHRVEHSCRLLETTSDGLEAISVQSGFNSLSTFLRAFSREKGCKPSDYRARHKRNANACGSGN